jgi:hypothetical protein
MKHS